MDADVIKSVLAALEREQVQYVVFGAVALNLLGLARATEDLDIFIAPTAENVERLKVALRSVFDDPEIDQITSEDLLGDYPAVRYAPPDGTFYLDILTRLGDAFAWRDLESQRVELAGLDVTVTTPRMLYRMKKDTLRAKDRGDAEMLRQHFGLLED